MKNTKRLLFLALAVVMVGGVAGVMIAKRQAAGVASQTGRIANANPAQVRRDDQSAVTSAVTAATQVAPDDTQKQRPIEATGQTNSTPQNAVAQAQQAVPTAKEPLKDPTARIALALVGIDEMAEAYWYGAINDPSLSPNERQDLIEDLNEDGLSDPKHPTADDLPLIVNRLLLIEEMGPDAMDKVNADAFKEAYKDLVNLANLVIGGGEPVR